MAHLASAGPSILTVTDPVLLIYSALTEAVLSRVTVTGRASGFMRPVTSEKMILYEPVGMFFSVHPLG